MIAGAVSSLMSNCQSVYGRYYNVVVDVYIPSYNKSWKSMSSTTHSNAGWTRLVWQLADVTIATMTNIIELRKPKE